MNEKETGSFYTPEKLIKFMVSYIGDRVAPSSILEPSAGDGRFIKHIEQLNNLFAAIDISQHENKTYEQYVMGVDLHRILFAAANNPQLERIGINTLDQESVFSYRSLINDTGRSKEMNDEHRMIAKYVIEQNPDKAEEAARYHIRQLIDRAEAKQPMVHYNSLLGNKLY